SGRREVEKTVGVLSRPRTGAFQRIHHRREFARQRRPAMKRETTLTHEFVEYIPQDLKDATVYVSIPFATAAHRCCCGCGKEVVTPISPTDWQLTFDGETISLEPSIGNWSFECQSHYWIKRNKVKWARRWSQREI